MDYYSNPDLFAAPSGDGEAGCPYCWCLSIPQIKVAQFMIGYIVCTAGFPYCIALIASIFSKVYTSSESNHYPINSNNYFRFRFWATLHRACGWA